MHVNPYMEEQAAGDRMVTGLSRLTTSTQNGDLDEGCPWDNLDGLPVDLGNRRPDLDQHRHFGSSCAAPPPSTRT